MWSQVPLQERSRGRHRERRGRGWCGSQPRNASSHPKTEEALRESATLMIPSCWTSGLQNWGNKFLLCLSCHVCGNSSRKPYRTIHTAGTGQVGNRNYYRKLPDSLPLMDSSHEAGVKYSGILVGTLLEDLILYLQQQHLSKTWKLSSALTVTTLQTR